MPRAWSLSISFYIWKMGIILFTPWGSYGGQWLHWFWDSKLELRERRLQVRQPVDSRVGLWVWVSQACTGSLAPLRDGKCWKARLGKPWAPHNSWCALTDENGEAQGGEIAYPGPHGEFMADVAWAACLLPSLSLYLSLETQFALSWGSLRHLKAPSLWVSHRAGDRPDHSPTEPSWIPPPQPTLFWGGPRRTVEMPPARLMLLSH